MNRPGVIRWLFDLLCDEEVIREDVFLKWRAEVREDGHIISVLSLKGFFEWLSEAEAETAADENS